MEGGLPLVTMSTVFQPSISLSYHFPRTSFHYAVNLVVQLYQPTHMPLHDTSYFMPSIWSYNYYSHAYSRTSVFIAVNQNYRMLYQLPYLILDTSVAYAVNQNYLSQLFAPSMPNMTPNFNV